MVELCIFKFFKNNFTWHDDDGDNNGDGDGDYGLYWNAGGHNEQSR